MAGGQAGNFGIRQAAVAVPMQPYSQPIAGQFVCPTHGSVGLPGYTAAGTPVCPLDGQPMQFISAGATNYAQAAGG
jgi:hypothetical protein